MNASWLTGLRALLAVGVLLGTSVAYADVPDSGDTAWMLTSTALVLFMTIPGLALFYAGLVRAANVLSVIAQCFAITCVVTLLWVTVGYSLAFGEGGAVIGDLSRALMATFSSDSVRGSVPEAAFAAFQLMFAIITPALIVGGMVERMKFSAVLLYTAVWSLVVYVPVAHWVWGGGWLQDMGFMDYAGGTVVHILAGTGALSAAIVVGPRRGFPDAIERPHNMVLTMTGAGMLWVGWLGFNGGSALTAGGDAAMAVLATHCGAAAGAFAWMLADWLGRGKPSALGTVTGMIAGLGCVTPAAGFISPGAALLIGAIAGVVCYTATNFMNLKLRIDDSLDVAPVHAVAGAVGTILVAVFASKALGVLGGGADISILAQLRVQAIGVLVVAIYGGVVSHLILMLTDFAVGNRVPTEHETTGLDQTSHDESGYAIGLRVD